MVIAGCVAQAENEEILKESLLLMSLLDLNLITKLIKF